MAAYATRATTVTASPDFLGRVRAAAMDYCLVVQAEGSGVANHDVRQTFADDLFADATGGWSNQLAWLVSADGTSNDSDDETIIARVASLWTQAASLAARQSAS